MVILGGSILFSFILTNKHYLQPTYITLRSNVMLFLGSADHDKNPFLEFHTFSNLSAVSNRNYIYLMFRRHRVSYVLYLGALLLSHSVDTSYMYDGSDIISAGDFVPDDQQLSTHLRAVDAITNRILFKNTGGRYIVLTEARYKKFV